MKSQMMAKLEGVWAHFPLRASEGVNLDDVRSGSGNSWGWPRVETMLQARMSGRR